MLKICSVKILNSMIQKNFVDESGKQITKEELESSKKETSAQEEKRCWSKSI